MVPDMNRISMLSKSIGFFAVVLFCVSPTFAQPGQGFGAGGPGGGMDMGMMGPPPAYPSPLEKLKVALRSAKGAKVQKNVLAKIKALLSNQYDSFLQQNESELQEMERSVKALRTQLERRKSAKAQLLNLELQRISNEATGLVWPDEQRGMGAMGQMGSMPAMPSMMGGGPGMGMSDMGGPREMDMGGYTEPRNTEAAIALDELSSEFDTDQETKTSNQLREISLAILNFVSAHMHFPGNISDEDGKPLLSWRVAILQYMGESEQALYKKFKLDEPWNSDHNFKLLDEMPDVYKHTKSKSSIKSVYLGFDGAGTMFESNKKIGFGMITDGSSNTLLVAQMNRQSAVEWSKPTDVKFTPGTAVSQLAETEDGSVIVARCDGSATPISLEHVDAKEIEHLIQRNDGNIISIDE